MDKNSIADILNGREYRDEIPKNLYNDPVFKNFVVVFGYSDDAMSVSGLFDDEFGCFDGGTAYFENNGFLHADDESEVELNHYKSVKAIWAKDAYSWVYETDMTHATFDIMEDGDKFCRGIVFDASELKNSGSITISKQEYHELTNRI